MIPITISRRVAPGPGPLSVAVLLLALVASLALPLVGQAETEDRRAHGAAIEAVKDWLIESGTDDKGQDLHNGLRRKISFRRPYGQTTVTAVQRADLQATAACKSLEFLSEYALAFDDRSPAFHSVLHEFAAAVLGLRSRTKGKIFSGAIATAHNAQMYVAFTNAICGEALLSAHAATGNASYLEAAEAIGAFLLNMQDPADIDPEAYGGVYRREETQGGLFDLVNHKGRLQLTMTTWNVVAVPFLDALSDRTSKSRYRAAAKEIADFHSKGVFEGYDYFAPTSLRATELVRTKWNLGYGEMDFHDGRWHRQGDVRQPPSGTIGTDQIEYGLDAMYRARYRVDELRRVYRIYSAYPNASGDARYDGRICFSGYFRIRAGSQPPVGVAYGNYYDAVGAGILAEFKRDQFPGDFERSKAILYHPDQMPALVDWDMQPVWSRRNGEADEVSVKGTLPMAAIGLGLLRTR